MTELPNLADLPPSEAHAAWMQWLKDNYPMKASLIPAATTVGMAVAEYESAFGSEAQHKACSQLRAKLKAFGE